MISRGGGEGVHVCCMTRRSSTRMVRRDGDGNRPSTGNDSEPPRDRSVMMHAKAKGNTDAKSKRMLSHTGFEPVTFRVLGERDNQLHQRDRSRHVPEKRMAALDEQCYMIRC